MKRSLLVLLGAVMLPCLLLSGLVLRSAQQQQIVLERRTAELCQRETDNVATAARSLVNERRREFSEAVEGILAGGNPAGEAAKFSASLERAWPQKAVGFAVDRRGRLVSPLPAEAVGSAPRQQFFKECQSFLGGAEAWTVYNVTGEEMNRPEMLKNGSGNLILTDNNNTYSQQKLSPATKGMNNVQATQIYRNVAPQQQLDSPESQLNPATADFRRLTGEGSEGVINRIVQDRLNMIFWVRPAQAREMVFGCLVHPEDFAPRWAEVFQAVRSQSESDSAAPPYVLALLDDKTRPVTTLPEGSPLREWKRPFVATEIGEALPHWEAALYLLHPEQLQASARAVRRTLYLLIGCALTAVACGSWTVLADTRRQLALAQKKTDFVSNVSHELKTPLTSIRMFAELMHGGRADPARAPQYLRIIMVEAERLTRLINNVLDFARLERREHHLEMRPLDFGEVIARVWEGHELHLREAGFATRWDAAEGPCPIVGDEDALAQALVNLLSNAEKYSGERKEIALRSGCADGWVEVTVLDRGSGVPASEEKKIFEAFYRAHDSLSSGIPGTGLGLSLASRVVEQHGGSIRCAAREGGGSEFTLRLPLAANHGASV